MTNVVAFTTRAARDHRDAPRPLEESAEYLVTGGSMWVIPKRRSQAWLELLNTDREAN